MLLLSLIPVAVMLIGPGWSFGIEKSLLTKSGRNIFFSIAYIVNVLNCELNKCLKPLNSGLLF